jgi:hypothetical protein
MFPLMVIFIGVFYYKHQSRQFTGFVYQCRSVLEKNKALRSLATKLHILARQADISVSINSHPDNIYV